MWPFSPKQTGRGNFCVPRANVAHTHTHTHTQREIEIEREKRKREREIVIKLIVIMPGVLIPCFVMVSVFMLCIFTLNVIIVFL